MLETMSLPDREYKKYIDEIENEIKRCPPWSLRPLYEKTEK